VKKLARIIIIINITSESLVFQGGDVVIRFMNSVSMPREMETYFESRIMRGRNNASEM